MTDGIKNRLIEALNSKEYIQITFKYPEHERRIFKKGFVAHVYDDSFDFNETFDGHVTYSFDFIIEIMRWGAK
jgi:hypothetical protein